MASVTITTTAAQDARLAPAMGAKLGLGRNATAAEVKDYLILLLRLAVQDYETEQQQAAITVQPFDPS